MCIAGLGKASFGSNSLFKLFPALPAAALFFFLASQLAKISRDPAQVQRRMQCWVCVSSMLGLVAENVFGIRVW